jgi:hypothetical protein
VSNTYIFSSSFIHFLLILGSIVLVISTYILRDSNAAEQMFLEPAPGTITASPPSDVREVRKN